MPTLIKAQDLIRIAQQTPCFHYWSLELDKTCTDSDIRHAYHQKSLTMHPDKPTGSTKLFQQLNKIHEILGDNRGEHDTKMSRDEDCSQITKKPTGKETGPMLCEATLTLE